MSFSIPTEIEKDIKCGKARYRTYQTGMGGQSVLPVTPNSYIIIFGYDYSPAGGGFTIGDGTGVGQDRKQTPRDLRPFETQQISFYTGQAFHPFIHHIDCRRSGEDAGGFVNDRYEMNNNPITRGVYIISSQDVAITVGLIQRVELNASNTIPVTNKTPQSLTYGGSAANMNVESIFSSTTANPLNFVQPSLSEFLDYGLGGVPGNAQDQAFAVPDQTDGLIDPTQWLQDEFGLEYREAAASNYFLNVHYAIYTNQTPEQLG